MKYVWEYLFPGLKEGEYAAVIVICGVMVALWLLTAVARWRTFNKMGEPGWKAFIPLYGYYVIYAKCWDKRAAFNYVCTTLVYLAFQAGVYRGSGSRVIEILCSVGELITAIELLYLTVRINFRMSKAFGHGFWFGFGLWILPFIFTFILGFGKSEYIGNPPLKGKKN